MVASKGLSILYLFLLADLFCCSAVLSVFFGFYLKHFEERRVFFSILAGLFAGLLFFRFSSSCRSHNSEYFPTYIVSLYFYLLYLQLFYPILFWKINFKIAKE